MPYTQAEEALAGARLTSRLSSVSAPVENLQKISSKIHEDLLSVSEFSIANDDLSTTAPIDWNKDFKLISAIQIPPKNGNTKENLICNLYHKVDTKFGQQHYGLFRFRNYRSSEARVQLWVNTGGNSLSLNAINNSNNAYRCGTFLIQLAIELSIQNGFNGAVTLNSTRDSGQFYFKLGFLPESKVVYDYLLRGEKVSGGQMYLPNSSIEAWKAKILQHPVLPETIEYLHDEEKLNQISGKALELHIKSILLKALRKDCYNKIYQLIERGFEIPNPELSNISKLLRAAEFNQNQVMIQKLLMLSAQVERNQQNTSGPSFEMQAVIEPSQPSAPGAAVPVQGAIVKPITVLRDLSKKRKQEQPYRSKLPSGEDYLGHIKRLRSASITVAEASRSVSEREVIRVRRSRSYPG